MLLADAPGGAELVVLALEGGKGVVGRLYDLGLVPGQRVTLVRRGFGRGPCLVEIGNRRVALGHGVARRVTVRLA